MEKTYKKEEGRIKKFLIFCEEFQKPANQRSFELFKKEFGKLLKHIVPRNFKAEGVIGFEDPSTTGLVFAGLAMLIPLCGDSLEIAADFEEPVIDVNLAIKGRIQVIWVVGFVLRLMMDKNIRRLFKKYFK